MENKIEEKVELVSFNEHTILVKDEEVRNKLEEIIKLNPDSTLEHLIAIADNRITTHDPKWRFVSGNIKNYLVQEEVWSNILDDVFHESFVNEENKSYLQIFIEKMIEKKKYDPLILTKYSSKDLEILDNEPNLRYNLSFDYAGMNLMSERYLMRDEKGNLLESPELMYMLLALFIAIPEKDSERLEYAKKYYHLFHSRQISPATPILMNLRKPKGNLTSCFIFAVMDSLLSINHTNSLIGMISKNGGGAACNVGRIRALGSSVNGKPNASSGVMSWVRIMDTIITSVDQENARKGSITIALPIWHRDVIDFLHCQTENGDLRKKAFNIFPQITIPDIFMRKVEADENWNMFDPYEVLTKYNVDLVELYGEKFDFYYNLISANESISKTTMKAKDLLKDIMKTQIETGLPYIFFSDTVNEVNPNKHVGMIANANLCVSGDTKILTDKGYVEIKSVSDTVQNIWNGEEFSESKVFKTSDGQKLLTFEFSNGSVVNCTEYHRFPILIYENEDFYNNVSAKDIRVGDRLIKFSLPDSSDYIEGVIITNISDNNLFEETYCFTEPKKHLGMFNGVLLSQCVESYSNFSPSKVISKPKLNDLNDSDLFGSEKIMIEQQIESGYTHSCNLASPNYDLIDDNNIEYIMRMTVRILDNTIALGEAPIAEAERHNNDFRIIGVGGVGYSDYLAKRKIKYIGSGDVASELFEKSAYYCLKESVQLAKERGKYPKFNGSEWSKGIVFGKDQEWFKNNKTSLGEENWSDLLSEIKQFGLRNGGISAIAPNSASSILIGATASILPIYSKMFVDKNSKGAVTIIPPQMSKDTYWYYVENKNINQNDLIDVVSEIQRWCDQGISTELILNIRDGIITTAKDYYDIIIKCWKSKMKTIYYIRQISNKGSVTKDECISCAN